MEDETPPIGAERGLTDPVACAAYDYARDVLRRTLPLIPQLNPRSEVFHALLAVATEAERLQRKLTGEPPPEPFVDFDEDYHWDSTPLLPGEKRLEYGEVAAGFDLRDLMKECDGPGRLD